MKKDSRHQCFIYEGSPVQHLPKLAKKLAEKLNEGYRCMYLNSPAMVFDLRSHLALLGLDILEEIDNGRIVLSSDAVLTIDGRFDPDLMINTLEAALDDALDAGFVGLWATGDMTWEFGPEKNFLKLLDYEFKLEKLFRKRKELCGICQYHTNTLPIEVARDALLAHQTIFINETVTHLSPFYVEENMTPQHTDDSELDNMIEVIFDLQRMKA